MRKLLVFMVLCSWIALPGLAATIESTVTNPFKTESLKQLWDIPIVKVPYTISKSYKKGGISVQEVYYNSRDYQRVPTKIFGYYCYPKSKGKLPAILLSHGGGGTASLVRAVDWARKGYAVLAIDLPGKGEKRQASRSTGPDMDVKNLLATQPDPSFNYLIYAVAAARNGISFLSQRKEVDAERIGMVGLSWGGVLTLLTNGQDSRLKAAVNVFGAGYIPEGCTWEKWFTKMPAFDKKIWDESLDPKNFLSSQHAPILFITGTNDHCYYLPIFQKSYAEITVQKKLILIPNLRHRFLASSLDPSLAWLDNKLRTGNSFSEIDLLTPTLEGKNIVLPIKATQAKSVKFYYSSGGQSLWTTRKWKELPLSEKTGTTYSFLVPTGIVTPEIMFFSTTQNKTRGAASTPIRSLFAIRLKDGKTTYALSSPIKRSYRHEAPLYMFNGMDAEKYYFSTKKGTKYFQALEKR